MDSVLTFFLYHSLIPQQNEEAVHKKIILKQCFCDEWN